MPAALCFRLLILHVFRLFTTRQNSKACCLLRFICRLGNWQLWHLSFLSDVKELRQTVPHFAIREFYQNQCIRGRPQKFSKEGKRRYFAYSFQVAADAMQIDVCKTLYHFYSISLCWLNLLSYFCYEMFSTQRQSRIIFSFPILHNIHFFEHFLRNKSRNLRKNKIQNNMSGEKTRKLDTLTQLFQARKNRTIC